jgi:hypothetical protein
MSVTFPEVLFEPNSACSVCSSNPCETFDVGGLRVCADCLVMVARAREQATPGPSPGPSRSRTSARPRSSRRNDNAQTPAEPVKDDRSSDSDTTRTRARTETRGTAPEEPVMAVPVFDGSPSRV